MKHKKIYLCLFVFLLIFALTACQSGEHTLYNVNTMHTATSFGFTDNGEAYVNVSYIGYQSTNHATIDIKIEKQGFLFFWDPVAQETLTADTEDYQNECFYPITENGNYRCIVTYTVSGTGENDVITFRDEKTYRKESSYTETTATSLTEMTSTKTTSTETTEAETTTTETTTTEIVTTQPPESEEEKALRLRYEAATEALNEYLANDTDDQETLKYLYHEFLALGDYEDSEMYLSRFTELSDMLTGIVLTKTNENGKTTETKVGGYTYNKNGQITSAFGEEMLKIYNISDKYIHHFIYDDEGKLLAIDVLYTKNDKNYRAAKLFAEYDENGKLVRLAEEDHEPPRPFVYSATNTRTYNVGENGEILYESIDNPPIALNGIPSFCKTTYFYHYNEFGDLTSKEARTSASLSTGYLLSDKYSENETWLYQNEYDDNGNLIQVIERWDYHSVYDYYDTTNRPSGGNKPQLHTTEKKKNEKITKNFTYDENGRIISVKVIDEFKPDTEQHLTYEYETLYFYQE